MGAAIATRLKEVGHTVTVWNRSANKVKPLVAAGAVAAHSPKDLAQKADIVITCLTDAEAIRAVYEGQTGLLAGDVRGRLFIEMSTVRPETEIALLEKVSAQGAALVECPVGGTVGPALAGKLIGLVGGEKEDVARAKPILDQLCRRVDHFGPIGAGSSVKLAINLPLATFWQSLGEAYALCKHLGADTNRLVELFADSSGGANVLRMRGAAVAKALSSQESGSTTFDCDSYRKDLRAMVAEAHARGFDLPLAERTLGVYDQASKEGWGKRDGTELPAYWTRRKR